MSAGHTPTPWRISKDEWKPWSGSITIEAVSGSDGADPAVILFTTSGGKEKANAELIVRAVNRDHLFDDVVKALKPFAKADDALIPGWHPKTTIENIPLVTRTITVGDLRSARAALAALSKAGGTK